MRIYTRRSEYFYTQAEGTAARCQREISPLSQRQNHCAASSGWPIVVNNVQPSEHFTQTICVFAASSASGFGAANFGIILLNKFAGGYKAQTDAFTGLHYTQ